MTTLEAVMDDHTDALASLETPSRPILNFLATPICVLIAGLAITAIADHQSVSIAWAYGALISGLGALVTALLAFRWHREAEASIAIRQELQTQSLHLSNLETEKRILRKALNDSEQRSRDLVSLSGAIVCELDENGKAGFVSAGIADLLGFAPADLVEVEVSQLVADTDREVFDQTLTAARQTRQLQLAEVSVTNVEHRQIPVTLRVLPLHDTLHGFSGFRLSMQPRPDRH